jgi:hypothetical protein
MPRFLCLIVFALSFPVGAVSQTVELSCSPTVNGNSAAQLITVLRTGVGTPYLLIANIKTEMKLPDGNILSGFTTSRQARDSQGRTRTDQPMTCAVDVDHHPQWQGSVMIDDPIAKTLTGWLELFNSHEKAATVTHLPDREVPHPLTAQMEFRMEKRRSDAYDRASPEAKRTMRAVRVEDLGQRTISGLGASGFRTTRTTAAGAEGNSLPLAYVEEKWVSDAYGFILLDINDDPVLGKSTYEVTNFTPGEPDASLFQVPAGYAIKELP